MSGINYKEFSEEEDRIYCEAIEKIKENMKSGMNIDQACEAVEVRDMELKRLITEDFLKITIAEMRFTQGIPLDVIAEKLSIPLSRVQIVFKMMIEDVMHTQAAKLGPLTPESLGFPEQKGNC